MHFITFPVASTNIFPLSNSTKGGQLVTEFNLKSRDMVLTNPEIEYAVGPSFLHSLKDFSVQLLSDSEVDEYSATKTYSMGDFCSYEGITYVRNTDESERVIISTGSNTYDLKDAENNPLYILRTYSITAGDTEISSDYYTVTVAENATTLQFAEGHAPQPNVNIVILYKGPEDFNTAHWTKTSISSSVLQINPGRAVINGHYVESLAPIRIDMNLANAELKLKSQEPLYGNLSVGIKSYFSTENTMSGSLLVENVDNMYVGIQIVIEPTSKFTVPGDLGCKYESEQGNATADLKLADFVYLNGSISSSSIVMNKDATRFIPSARISDFNDLLDKKYVTAENLVGRMFYTMSGVSRSWCDSTGSLMVWDHDPIDQLMSKAEIDALEELYGREAHFRTDPLTGKVSLVVPHKQQDGAYTDATHKYYYMPKVYDLPTASYATGSSGIVTEEYTQNIKNIASVINTYKQFTNGKQITFLNRLTIDGEGELSYKFPTDLTNYNVGDYIVVREDYTVNSSEDEGIYASTMYIVLPGGVTAISAVPTTTAPSGIRLGNPVDWDGESAPEESSPSEEELLELLAYTQYRGTTNDYFELLYSADPESSTKTSYYYQVTATGLKGWSEPVLLTGGVPLASEDQIGGFYNASTDAAYADAGYVYLDDTGHLRLRDYALLRSGALAYQLGDSISITANQTVEYIQEYLDEYVNDRVAFPSNIILGMVYPVIDITIPLPADETGEINIYNVDSRFNTSVYLHFVGDLTKNYANLVINLYNCARVRIDSSITALSSGPVINLHKSCLYYDAAIIDYIRNCDVSSTRSVNFTGFEDLTLWYARFNDNDPDLVVSGMEVSQPNANVESNDITFWDTNISNDNHYGYALRSITLSNSGKMVACSIYVSNVSTATSSTDIRTIIGGDFKLPQSSTLNYPESSINNPIQITGTFTTAYMPSGRSIWIVTDTSFTARTGVYSKGSGVSNGKIAFNASTYEVEPIYTANITDIEGWAPGAYHIFYGGTTTV